METVSVFSLLALRVVSGYCELSDLSSSGLSDIGIGLGSGSVSGADYSSAGGSDAIATSYSSGYSYNRAPVTTKHVYVHLAPEEQQIARQNRIFAPSQPRRRYKIIFIKAPTQAPPTGAQIQIPQQDEEKTLIYILSKKQDEQAEIKIQKPVPTKPSKPEVYFIRYKTQKTSEGGYGPKGFSAPSTGYNQGGGQVVSSSYGAPSSSSSGY